MELPSGGPTAFHLDLYIPGTRFAAGVILNVLAFTVPLHGNPGGMKISLLSKLLSRLKSIHIFNGISGL